MQNKAEKNIDIKQRSKILPLNSISGENLYRNLAFEESSQANIVSTINEGKIITVNKAVCKLLGYSKKELLTKKCQDIFDKKIGELKRMLKSRRSDGAPAIVSMIRKNGEHIPCEVTSAVFKINDGIENGIINITDLRERILKQKELDAENAKIVAHNISVVKSKQKIIDVKNAKAVAHNISLAISRQKKIDVTNAKLVAKNIVTAISKQIDINVKNANVVAQNIALAIAKQKTIDATNAKLVAKNIVVAISKQIQIDIKNEKIVARNIALAIAKHTTEMNEAKETERSEIGKELHDNVNQLLGASKLYMDMAKKDKINSDLYLNKSSEYTMMAIEEIRKLSKALTTDIIQDLGLCDAFDLLVADTMMVSNIKITLEYDSFVEESVDHKFKLNIYRIAQEQLNNILKHAKASKVEISLKQNKKSIELLIFDNGIGFNTKKKTMGIGLANMKSRAASNQGSILISSEEGKGCFLKAKFAIPPTKL